MNLLPMPIAGAKAWVAMHHRHNKRIGGALFALAAASEGRIVGVAIVGLPAARKADDMNTAEIRRVCTDGTHNACSFLLGAAKRAARALGYQRIITYTLPEESGSSLRAAAFMPVARTRGGRWARDERARADQHPLQGKIRWEATA